ncbi:MAG TPA: hypothetical protein PKV84_01560 [Candidatus Omnitrophota bacterium]|nr:hypothetical protein [Candidatus Omnitrophota bacterium]
MNECDMACDILRKTKDGDDLSPEHLWLVENAVNGFLNEKGQEKFRELFAEVSSGKYQKPYLHGIEFLTINHEGFVHWRGKHVEHFDISFAFSEKGREAALELARRCRYLEQKEIEVNVTNVVWRWKKFQ